LESHSDKARLREVKMKLRKNKLPIIEEEGSMIMDEEDLEEVFKLNDEINMLEKKKKASEEENP